jgi:hypothetical protein
MTDGWTIASTVAVAASAAVTAAMAYYTRRAAEKTAAMATAAQKEADAVVEQGLSIKSQAEATAAQAAAVEEQATASGHQVELTRQSLEASFLPWLTLGTDEQVVRLTEVAGGTFTSLVPDLVVNDMADPFQVSIRLRNVGTGLAVIDATTSVLVGWKDPRSGEHEMMNFNRAQVGDPIIPPGAQARINFSVPLARWNTDVRTLTNQMNSEGEFALDVVYSDTAGRQTARLRIRLAYMAASSRWVPFELNYFRPPDAASPSPSVRVDR